VRVDLEILMSLVDEWSPHIPELVEYDAKGLLTEFGDTLRAELDYGREATNEEFSAPSSRATTASISRA
jgi:predicted unusual protein kinase regulating ubiquinone biosynthesis (AarF/ABC1/UbiB family)